jgi:predicted TIM-barrel fold metal-dependent hydrolase
VGELAVYGNGITAEVVQALEPVMALCLERNGLFMLHTNEPVGHQYPGKTPNTLRQIYDFVKTYPNNRIILAHWGGGLLFYALMKKEVKTVLQNVWFDTAASPFLYRPEMYRVAGEVVGFDKLLFGSDYPLLKPQRYFKEMGAAGLTTDQMNQITGLNAQHLLA